MVKKNELTISEGGLSLDELRDMLVPQGFVTKEQFEQAVSDASKLKKPVETIIVEQGAVSNKQLGTLIAQFLDTRYTDFDAQAIDQVVMEKIPESVARTQWVLAYGETPSGVKIAMNNPRDLELRQLLEQTLARPLIVSFTTRKDLNNIFFRYKQGLNLEFKKLLLKAQNVELADEKRDESIIEIVDTLLQYAYYNKASDIHIEPFEDKVVVRFRIDGLLHDMIDMPRVVYELALTRIKILSRMRTDEHLAAQDGKLRFEVPGVTKEKVDVRVSIVPVIYGEKVVMRILSSQGKEFTLADLGFSDKNFQKVYRSIQRPHGMILVTGPTGSGKTTTLYAVLKILNTRDVNIATIEDPVEYNIEGVSQIQVNPKTDLTFAKGLRSIVRQDPDIIMVGEVRDSETAGISVNAALTGHLVLSTLHTNDAATTLPRLLDMEVEPFLVASTVNLVIAQRLVRKICPTCRISYQLSGTEDKTYAYEILQKHLKSRHISSATLRLYKGKGCQICGNTGFLGRFGVFEVMEITENIRRLIIGRSSSDQIRDEAVKEGMDTMFEDGLDKVLAGTTTIEEVLRVTTE